METEVLIYDLKINKAFCLNQTSALVYNLADGTKTVAEICDLKSKRLKTLVCEDFVWLPLDGLNPESAIEKSEQNRYIQQSICLAVYGLIRRFLNTRLFF